MHSKNYQPDSFHRLVLHGLLYTFFADEYTCTYAADKKDVIFPINFYAVLRMLCWDVIMPSSTITVRFEDDLYNRIKNHEICTSDLIRNGVRMYLDMLGEEESYNHPVTSDVEPVRSYELQDVRQSTHNRFYEEKPMERKISYEGSSNYNKTTYSIDKLKREIRSLNDEVSSLVEKYKDFNK